MKDRLVKILLEKLNLCLIDAGQIKKQIEDCVITEQERVIPISMVIDMVKDISERIDEEKKYLTPKSKFLYVEDGSVDVDELASDLYMTNPEIKIVVYRQGSHPPILSDKEN